MTGGIVFDAFFQIWKADGVSVRFAMSRIAIVCQGCIGCCAVFVCRSRSLICFEILRVVKCESYKLFLCVVNIDRQGITTLHFIALKCHNCLKCYLQFCNG